MGSLKKDVHIINALRVYFPESIIFGNNLVPVAFLNNGVTIRNKDTVICVGKTIRHYVGSGRIELIELTAVNNDDTGLSVVVVKSPAGGLALEATAVDSNLTTAGSIDKVVMIFINIAGNNIITVNNVGEVTAVDDYITTVSPDCHIPIVITSTVEGTVTVDGKSSAGSNVEDTVTHSVIRNGNYHAVSYVKGGVLLDFYSGGED